VTTRTRYRWAHTTAPRRALDLTFDVQTTDPELGEFLDHVLRGLPDGERDVVTKPVRFGLAEFPARAGEAWPRCVVRRAHRTIDVSHHPSIGLDRLFGALNRATVRASAHRVLLHAGLVGFGDRALLLVGASGSGKSSLTGMLCTMGAQYGTDEITAIDPITGSLEGAGRPIVLKPSAPKALVDRFPPKPAAARRYLDLLRPVAPEDVGAPPMVARPRSVGVVFVRYAHAAAPASLAPIPRADAVAALVSSCWNRRAHGRVAFDAAVELARVADVAELEFSDCVRAAEALHDCFGNS
jgi:hypothetical protein